MVLTRLHARYDATSLSDDIVFRAADSIVGGREHVVDDKGNLEKGAVASSGGVNNFQARYIIRHPWTGPIKCQNPYAACGADLQGALRPCLLRRRRTSRPLRVDRSSSLRFSRRACRIRSEAALGITESRSARSILRAVTTEESPTVRSPSSGDGDASSPPPAGSTTVAAGRTWIARLRLCDRVEHGPVISRDSPSFRWSRGEFVRARRRSGDLRPQRNHAFAELSLPWNADHESALEGMEHHASVVPCFVGRARALRRFDGRSR